MPLQAKCAICIGPAWIHGVSATAKPQGVLKHAVTLAKKGYQVSLVSRWGRDELGDQISALLRQEKVNCTFVKRPFNCATHVDDVTELQGDSNRGDVTLDDLLQARALFLSAQLLVIDPVVANEVLHAALRLAKQHALEVVYVNRATQVVRNPYFTAHATS